MKIKKKICYSLLSVLWIFILICPAMASEIPSERQKPLLVDEACLLTEEEKIKMCELVTNAGADYIKTSTGFSTGGATFDDIQLFAKHVGEGVKIKAAGGISNMDDAEKFLTLGADRLGTSRIVKIVKKEEGAGY